MHSNKKHCWNPKLFSRNSQWACRIMGSALVLEHLIFTRQLLRDHIAIHQTTVSRLIRHQSQLGIASTDHSVRTPGTLGRKVLGLSQCKKESWLHPRWSRGTIAQGVLNREQYEILVELIRKSWPPCYPQGFHQLFISPLFPNFCPLFTFDLQFLELQQKCWLFSTISHSSDNCESLLFTIILMRNIQQTG